MKLPLSRMTMAGGEANARAKAWPGRSAGSWPSAPRNPVDTMPLLLNIETLAKGPVRLRGELSPEELDMETLDELVEADEPLDYDLTAERAGDNILLRGRLTMRLQCECARCLRPFVHRVELLEWSCLLPLAGRNLMQGR